MDRTTVWGKVEDADGEAPPRSIVIGLDGEHKGPALPMDLHPVARTDQAGQFCAMDLPHGACKLAADCEAFGAGIRGGRATLSMDVTIPPPKEDGELVLKYPFSRRQFARVHGSVHSSEPVMDGKSGVSVNMMARL
jgi:hypothetical protein